ncbi:hypothetical protein LCGC14_1161360 [marine sediment metagenome]|uniref:Uncharacterized protein n=1 Tax=marine sediment metagenome TaxID=412755 RepID=A0A0F9PY59_9ZZZZ
MRADLNYYEILEETLKEKMEWLKEEFEIMFAPKTGKFTIKDKKIANDILDYVLEHNYVYDNFILLNLINETVKKIEEKYVNLL